MSGESWAMMIILALSIALFITRLTRSRRQKRGIVQHTTSSIGGEGAKGASGGGSDEKAAGIFWGRALCVLGLISALVGAFGVEVSMEVVGIVLGMLGYALGAQRLGKVTVILSTIAMFVALVAYEGYVSVPWPVYTEI